MPNPTNLPVTQNPTQSYFDNLNSPGTQPTVSDGEYEAVLSFFEYRAATIDAAKSLASAFLQACVVQSLNPLTQLDIFKKLSQDKIDLYLAMFFNNTRYGTSLLGVNAKNTVNSYIQRAILP
jgi:hypothetical protein